MISVLQLQEGPPQSQAILSHKIENKWHDLSYQKLIEQSLNIADYLISRQVSSTTRIAILFEATPYWGMIFLAAVRAGCIVVPLDPKWRYADLRDVIEDSQPDIIFVSQQYLARLQILQSQGTKFDVIAIDSSSASPFSTLSALAVADCKPPVERLPEKMAMLCYTSGSTGKPKGVALSLDNLSFEAAALKKALELNEGDVYLSTASMSNLLELTTTFLAALTAGSHICYLPSSNSHDIVQAISEKSVSIVNCNATTLRTLKLSMLKEIESWSTNEQSRFERAFHFSMNLPWFAARRMLFRKLHKHFGGKLRGLVCAGFLPDSDIYNFYEHIGIPVHSCYGLTEAGPVISINTKSRYLTGSLGRCLPGIDLRIDAEHGEILTRGPHVMMGYWQNQQVDNRCLNSQGWLNTKDLGSIDNQGFFQLSGQAANIITLTTGLTVQPEQLEKLLGKAPSAAEVCVFSPDNKTLEALVLPSIQLRYILDNNIAKLTTQIRQEFDKLLEEVPPDQRVSSVLISLEPLPKTAEGKFRRHELSRRIKTQSRDTDP